VRARIPAWVWLAVAILAAAASAPAQPPAKPARVVPWRGTAPAPQGADTLDVRDILARRSARLDSLLNSETAVYDTTGIDSLVGALDRGGAAVAERVKPHTPLKLHVSLRPLTMTTYDRVNGLRLGSGVGARAGRIAAINADAAYAFARERWSGAAEFSSDTPWKRLGVAAHWADRIAPFGPNQGAYFTSFMALIAGQDRQDYLHENTWDAGLSLRPARRSVLGLRYSMRHESNANAETDFHFFGSNTPISQPNPQVETRITRALVLDGEWSSRHRLIHTEAEAGIAGGTLGGQFTGAWQAVEVRYAPPIGKGDLLILETKFQNVAGAAPTQAVSYLGGDGNLRGYERLEFAGRQALSVRAEYEVASDLLARSGLPIVRRLHLQFIPFADAGTTWGNAASIDGSSALDGAWKSSLGIGIQRHLYYPVFGAVRLDVSRRTDGGPGGASLWFRIMPLEP